ncbi:biopolymer transporter ExbD [Isosphaeraceae bacterium EP7]
MSGSASIELKAEPNLTPLLDIVFQLITFFMLVINFSSDNYDQRIKLPVAGSARPVTDPEQAVEDRLVLNLDSEGRVLFNGKVLTLGEGIDKIKFEAQLARLNAKAAKIKLKDNALPTRVVIRADRNMPFGPLHQLLAACQSNGYQKFDFKAMSGPP